MPKICIVADIHHGADQKTKKGTAARALMTDFAAFCADQAPDAVLDLGDRISDIDHDTDAGLERDVARMFAPIAAPVHHLCGNHDRDFLSVAENEEILGQSLQNTVVDLGNWSLVLFRADAKYYPTPDGRTFRMDEADLLWLANVVGSATRPLLIASHVPLSGHDQTGNYYFQQAPDQSRYPQTARIRAVLASARVPMVCIAGHVHWNTVTMVDAIPHLTQQSLTESFTTFPDPAGAMGVLDLDETHARWVVHGRDAMDLTLPLAQTTRRWMVPMGDGGA